MAKRRVLLSLSRDQIDNGMRKVMDSIAGVNLSIDERAAKGEEIAGNDDSVMKVRKLRMMLTVMANA